MLAIETQLVLIRSVYVCSFFTAEIFPHYIENSVTDLKWTGFRDCKRCLPKLTSLDVPCLMFSVTLGKSYCLLSLFLCDIMNS